MIKFVYFFTKLFFPKADLNKTWVTFGKNIYGPVPVPPEILVHEQVHVAQQKNWLVAILYWALYLASKKFRYYIELPAYQAQLDWYVKQYPDKAHQYHVGTAKVISGPQYNNMVGYWRALCDLKVNKI